MRKMKAWERSEESAEIEIRTGDLRARLYPEKLPACEKEKLMEFSASKKQQQTKASGNGIQNQRQNTAVLLTWLWL